MVLRRRAELAATSRADDLALRALAEIVEITSDENVRIVGGQMVSLLLAAFPVSGIAPRRTRDADTAITTELAGSGVLHDRLIDRGWVATTGNNYVRPVPELGDSGQSPPELSVDLLVPSLDGQFRPSRHGGRAFDSAPGLAPALAAEPVEIVTGMRLLDGTGLEFVAVCPPSRWPWLSRHTPMPRAGSIETSRTSTGCSRSSTPIEPTPSADGGSASRTCGAPGAMRPSGCTNWAATRGG